MTWQEPAKWLGRIPHVSPNVAPPPFVPPGATLTAFGRQALSLVARELRARGVRLLLGPDHHCQPPQAPPRPRRRVGHRPAHTP